VKIALYRGISPVSKFIEFFTRSRYSHAAFLFDVKTETAASDLRRLGQGRLIAELGETRDGAVVEAWSTGVQNSACLGTLHEPHTIVDIFSFKKRLTFEQEKLLLIELNNVIGDPYSWTNVLRFITRRPGSEDGSWFCSEMVFTLLAKIGVRLFERTEGWEVQPGLIARSTLIEESTTVITEVTYQIQLTHSRFNSINPQPA
jgi:hypothetical protein